MLQTLRYAFAIKNTTQTNTVLYALKQLPLIKKWLPDTLYAIRGCKILANILAFIWELLTMFLGKAIYIGGIVAIMTILSPTLPLTTTFLHILWFLSLIGMIINTDLIHPSQDKYYAITLLRMDARAYTLALFFYSLIKIILGMIPVLIFFKGLLPLYQCFLFPIFIVMMKLGFAGCYVSSPSLQKVKNDPGVLLWICLGGLLALAFIPPYFGYALPSAITLLLFWAMIPFGLWGLWRIWAYPKYDTLYKSQYRQIADMMDADSLTKIRRETSEKNISNDRSIHSHRYGFAYLNDLFMKRHRKILWRSVLKISAVICTLVILALMLLPIYPDEHPIINELVMTWLPYFVFILYAINRGSSFTQALFINCDHSLLTYSFYKEPKAILQLFAIRLKSIILLNALPALCMGVGLSLLLYFSGGTHQPLNYLLLILTPLFVSAFFSIHYLTIYYLLQPYNAKTQLKSPTYSFVQSAVYFICLFIMNLRIPVLFFGLGAIGFCILYIFIACVAIYHLAPKTFRIRP